MQILNIWLKDNGKQNLNVSVTQDSKIKQDWNVNKNFKKDLLQNIFKHYGMLSRCKSLLITRLELLIDCNVRAVYKVFFVVFLIPK